MENLAPSKEDRKKFDIDLEYGKVREQFVADMLQNKKIEKIKEMKELEENNKQLRF